MKIKESNLFTQLLVALHSIDWTKSDAQRRVEELFGYWWQDKARLLKAIQISIQEMDLPYITRVAELHSWLLYNCDEFTVKLNQFLPGPNTGKHSENVHDHTREPTSLTLNGGYTQNYFDPEALNGRYKLGDTFRMADLPSCEGDATGEGTIYTLDTKLFHALTDFVNGTLTLCVYGPIKKDRIRVFNTVSGYVEERTSYGSAKLRMLDQLELIPTKSAPPIILNQPNFANNGQIVSV